MKKTLGEVGRKPSLADVDLSRIKPTNVVLSLEEFLQDAKRLMIMFFNNDFEPAVEGIQLYSETSTIHALALSMLHFLKMMLTMSKAQMDVACGVVSKTVARLEAQRYQRSYKNLLVRPNYNNFTDQNCQAEITFVLTNLIYGCLIALRDQSVLGIVNAGYKINVAYRTLNECVNIQKHKTNWTSEEAKTDFSSVCYVTQGAFEIVLSMFPSKLAKLLEYIGFNCNQKHALQLISKSCESPDVLTYHVSSFILTTYYGMIEFVYGLGDKNMEILNKFCSVWTKKCPNGAFTHLVTGITEMNKANFHVSVHCFKRVIDEQDYWPQLHFLAHLCLLLCYSVLEDNDSALVSAARLRDKCKWSSSLFYYLHSSFLLAKMKDQTPEEQKESRKTISEQLKMVPSLKRKLGGIHVFHEELSITRSKRYHDRIDEWVLPGFELYQFWNMYHLMEDNQNHLEMKLKQIDKEFERLEKVNLKSEDATNYLLFHRASIYRHMNRSEEAEALFKNVINKEKALKFNTYLVPASWYELSQIKYDQGDLKECKRCLKKVNSFGSYFGEGLISFRVNLMTEKLKNTKVSSPDVKS